MKTCITDHGNSGENISGTEGFQSMLGKVSGLLQHPKENPQQHQTPGHNTNIFAYSSLTKHHQTAPDQHKYDQKGSGNDAKCL